LKHKPRNKEITEKKINLDLIISSTIIVP
jgi:hypothetical protein